MLVHDALTNVVIKYNFWLQ